MKRKGFTLLELSIVLVIIGLLAGAIVVGEDLISNAAVRSTIADVQKIDTSINAFRLKYESLPGDTKRAVQMGLGTPGGPGDNGNGNGTVDADSHMMHNENPERTKEVANLFFHLAKGGLLNGEFKGYDGTPGLGGFRDYVFQTRITDATFITAMSINPVHGEEGLQMGNSVLVHGMASDETLGIAFAAGMTAGQAYAIDNKLDDAVPDSGAVQTQSAYSGPAVGPNSMSCTYVSGGIHYYDVQGIWLSHAFQVPNNPPRPNQVNCALAIKGTW